MKAENIALSQSLLGLIKNEPFMTAHECSEQLDITVQKASAVLRAMEAEGAIFSKRIKAGRNEVKCYFIKKKEDNYVG